MKTAKAKTNDKQYTRDEAAEHLGISLRQLAKYISQELIQTETAKRPGKDGVVREMVLIRQSELDKIPEIKKEFEARKRKGNSTALAIREPQTAALAPVTNQQTTIQQTALIVPLHKKLWLTLEEAKAYSGLPESILLEAARTVEGIAIKHGRWLFHRERLESYVPQ